MPAYDFRCPECAEAFEVIRPMGAAHDECCPSCGAPATRVFSPVGVAFKGSGFHNTDYRARPAEDSAANNDAPTCPAKGDSASCADCPAAT